MTTTNDRPARAPLYKEGSAPVCIHSARRPCPDCLALERAQQWQAACLRMVEDGLVTRDEREVTRDVMRVRGD
jgi:hypothetical protein